MIRRFLTRILMVTLIACCAYNWVQVRRLQVQVGALNARLAVRQPPEPAADWAARERELRRDVRDLKNALDSVRSPQQFRKEADALRRDLSRH